ncbi:hypothetical protein [Streptomyces sp. Go-475]|uniref:hypothetical protein n=1 Tax=Streptomyces sp. Go-475 TaxID=2072505 RepID=UPI000DEF1799|nr:hypothetical protein [Streptomyces sp. Go-475]AXE87084.1 hypothetical protein C1703_18975 [Streptomyces sp. Go-475]
MRIPALPRARSHLSGLLLTGAVAAAVVGGAVTASTTVVAKTFAVQSGALGGVHHVPIQYGDGQIIPPHGAAA